VRLGERGRECIYAGRVYGVFKKVRERLGVVENGGGVAGGWPWLWLRLASLRGGFGVALEDFYWGRRGWGRVVKDIIMVRDGGRVWLGCCEGCDADAVDGDVL